MEKELWWWRCFILLFFSSCTLGQIINHLDIDETSVSAGIEHSCAIHALSMDSFGGEIICWGMNHHGQSTPPKGEFIQVSSGRFHSCGIRLDETIDCWGNRMPGIKPTGLYTQISAGEFHTCGILKDQTVHCWGKNTYGQNNAPSGKFIQVSSGKGHTCGLRPDGQVECWGKNSQGECSVPLNKEFLQVSASPGDFTCGITKEKVVECWGSNIFNQCNVPSDIQFLQISTSRLSSCGLTIDKKIQCWGLKDGLLHPPLNIEFDEISLGWNHGCGLTAKDGKIICWGNTDGNRLNVPLELR